MDKPSVKMCDKITCTLCGESMDHEEWSWSNEDAHKNCVLDIANYVCADCGVWFDIDAGSMCQNCGSEDWIKLTPEEKQRIRDDPDI